MEKKGTDENLDNNMNSTPENELLKLLNQFNPDDPADEDIQSITDLLGGLEEGLHNDISPDNNDKNSSNISIEVQNKEKNIESSGQNSTEANDDKEKSIKKEKKKIKKADNKDKTEKSKAFLKRLFGTAKKDKNVSASSGLTDPIESLEPDRKRRGIKTINMESDYPEELTNSKKEAHEKKKAKKAKKEKKKKEIRPVTEDVVDEGHINKAGAAVVFIMFGIIVITFMAAMKSFTYTQNIKNAARYFERREYTQAYDEIDGLDLKDNDVELFNKIKTVMMVNKELDSYYNYCNMRMFPEALDSLLKGLKRYDKYIELATLYGIKDDMDYIRNEIIDELNHRFGITEEEAMDIIKIDNQADYTEAVYDAVKNITIY